MCCCHNSPWHFTFNFYTKWIPFFPLKGIITIIWFKTISLQKIVREARMRPREDVKDVESNRSHTHNCVIQTAQGSQEAGGGFLNAKQSLLLKQMLETPPLMAKDPYHHLQHHPCWHLWAPQHRGSIIALWEHHFTMMHLVAAFNYKWLHLIYDKLIKFSELSHFEAKKNLLRRGITRYNPDEGRLSLFSAWRTKLKRGFRKT